jgi:D-serine deaminase-like pyridoxal phosphate-dependent protein
MRSIGRQQRRLGDREATAVVENTQTTLLDTPALVLDERAALANIAATSSVIRPAGARIRPDVSVHRSAQIARLQMESVEGDMGIAVTRVEHAVSLAAFGFCDTLITWPTSTRAQLERLAGLLRLTNVAIVTDGYPNIADLDTIARSLNRRIEVSILVDVAKSGWGASSAESVAVLAKSIRATSSLELGGIVAHLSKGPTGKPLARLLCIRRELEGAGFPMPKVTVVAPDPGAILTVAGCADEVVSAHYVFGTDGVSPTRDLWVASTVISRQRPDVAVTDCGQKGVGLDDAMPELDLPGYGIRRINAEHAILDLPPDAKLRVGDIVRFHPRNVTATVLLHRSYQVLAENGSMREWPIDVTVRD